MSSVDMHIRFPPEQCQSSRRVDTGICGFPLRLYLSALIRATVV